MKSGPNHLCFHPSHPSPTNPPPMGAPPSPSPFPLPTPTPTPTPRQHSPALSPARLHTDSLFPSEAAHPRSSPDAFLRSRSSCKKYTALTPRRHSTSTPHELGTSRGPCPSLHLQLSQCSVSNPQNGRSRCRIQHVSRELAPFHEMESATRSPPAHDPNRCAIAITSSGQANGYGAKSLGWRARTWCLWNNPSPKNV